VAYQPRPVTTPKSAVGEQSVYVLIRRDLHMRRRKEIAQGIHAVAALGYVVGAPLIVLQVDDLIHLTGLTFRAELAGVPFAFTRDAGRTEVEPGTITAAAIGPVAKGKIGGLADAKLY
jgi:PTH2 family peptidyl-tRNA hydrolase